MTRAPFIALEGLDGTGKSTQCRLLAEWIAEQGLDPIRCADPGGTPLGDQLRAVLLDHRQEMSLAAEAFLFMASRAELVARIIRPALADGKAVISDRFLLSNVVYQGHAGGLDPDDLWHIGRVSTNGLEPDLTLILDVPPETAAMRRAREHDRIERKGSEYLARVRQGFLIEAAIRPERMIVVDASGSLEQVQLALRREVERRLSPWRG